MRYAVSHCDWFDHEITTVFVEAETPEAAMKMHPKVQDFEWAGATVDELKCDCFDCDCMVHAEPVP